MAIQLIGNYFYKNLWFLVEAETISSSYSRLSHKRNQGYRNDLKRRALERQITAKYL